jgi:hypothetical protein
MLVIDLNSNNFRNIKYSINNRLKEKCTVIIVVRKIPLELLSVVVVVKDSINHQIHHRQPTSNRNLVDIFELDYEERKWIGEEKDAVEVAVIMETLTGFACSVLASTSMNFLVTKKNSKKQKAKNRNQGLVIN